ncbi:MAG: MFS transporter [Acidiphilium sp.]
MTARAETRAGPSARLVGVFAFAAGAVVANLYYAQPLIGLIDPALHLPKAAASLLVTLTQLGYAAGLLFLVPLGDLVENRKLIVRLVAASAVALVLAAASVDGAMFLAAALLIGIASCAVQILVPMVATLTPDATRGRVVGNVMGGLVLGILLARPLASGIAYLTDWRAVFAISAAGMAALALVLRKWLPQAKPKTDHGYWSLIGSMFALYRHEPTLRRRALYQCAAFGAFSLYWTAVPLLLAEQFHYTQAGIAVFALVGAAGAISAPLAGRLADAGHGRLGSAVSLALILVSFGLSAFGAAAHSVVLLALAGVALDFGVQANNVFGQRAIYALAPELRARLNGAYMAAFFLGGAAGSAVASTLLIDGGWALVAKVGAALPAAALLLFGANEIRRFRSR